MALRVVELSAASKPAQLNVGWRAGDAPYVLVTDVDALLPASVIERLVAALERDGACALVGTAVQPASPFLLERVYWHYSNRLRALEARWLGSAGLVVGPCYLARRATAVAFQADVVSDDAHMSLSALARGWRVAFLDEHVREMRGPATLREFLAHKGRKAGAYLREVFRVLTGPHSRRAGPRAVLILRLSLLTVLPWAITLATAAAVWFWPGGSAMAAAGVAAMAAVRSSLRRHPWPAVAGAVATVALPWLVAFVLVATMLVYPFARWSPSYPKVTMFADPEA
jgi:cellulose synthase/poly-beta-1,6-N-acetylglucosamine synthase-like glycosyltransferase